MKKLFIIVLSALTLSASGYAQKVKDDSSEPKYGRRVLVNKFSDNWEISARMGTQGYMGEYCLDVFKFKDWFVFPAIDLGFAKWGTNSIGMAVGFTYSPFKSLYYTGGKDETKYATFAKPTDPFYKPNFKIATGHMGNAYVSAIFNLNNLFGGYKKDRIYNLIANIGGGMMFPMSPTQYRDLCASFNAGLVNKFRIAGHLTFDLAIRGTLHDDMFNGVSYYDSDDHKNLSVDATIGITAGISYRFNWISSKKRDAKGRKVNEEGWYTVDEIVPYTDSYRNVKSSLEEAKAAVTAAETALSGANQKIKEQEDFIRSTQTVAVKGEPFSYRQLVNFVIDRWEISNREKVSILIAAEAIKAHPDTKFIIAGYADKQTASMAHNRMLSDNRAEAVYNCLVNEFGVNPDQLQKASYGGVDYMFFNDKQCSRSVLITSKDILED